MEEENSKLQEQSSQESFATSRTKVGFPQAQESSKKFNIGPLIIVIIILAILGGGAWYLFGREDTQEVTEDLTPTPFIRESTPTPQEKSIDKDNIRIQVLNGTGLSGAAGLLKSELGKLDYTDIEVGNANSQTNTATKVTFSKSLSESTREEILKKLESLYKEVESAEGTSNEFDVVIITGYPTGHTPTPTKKPTTSPSPSPSVSGTTTPSPTTTSTPTPTP